MTETATEYQLPTEPVVPEGRDPIDDLTAGELGHVGKLIKYDPVSAVSDPTTGLRWPALAHLAWVWARRVDPKAKLQPFLDSTPRTLTALLRLDEDDDAAQEVGADVTPTDSPAAS